MPLRRKERLSWTADAELIVASDPHLADLHPWREIPILPPVAGKNRRELAKAAEAAVRATFA